MMQFAAPVGIISLGIVVVLLVGEIDLSVGSVSGLSAAIMAVLLVYHGQPTAGRNARGIRSAPRSACSTRALQHVGVPSFVITLAGLLGFQGALLVVLGKNGTVNLPNTSGIAQFARNELRQPGRGLPLVIVIAGGLRGAHAPGSAPHGAGLLVRRSSWPAGQGRAARWAAS